MSLTVAVIVIAALVVLLLAALAFVMSRPKGLRPHQPGRWRLARLRSRRRARPNSPA